MLVCRWRVMTGSARFGRISHDTSNTNASILVSSILWDSWRTMQGATMFSRLKFTGWRDGKHTVIVLMFTQWIIIIRNVNSVRVIRKAGNIMIFTFETIPTARVTVHLTVLGWGDTNTSLVEPQTAVVTAYCCLAPVNGQLTEATRVYVSKLRARI